MRELLFLSFMKVMGLFVFLFVNPFFVASSVCSSVCLSFCLSVPEYNFKYKNNPSFDERVIVPKFYVGNCIFLFMFFYLF